MSMRASDIRCVDVEGSGDPLNKGQDRKHASALSSTLAYSDYANLSRHLIIFTFTFYYFIDWN